MLNEIASMQNAMSWSHVTYPMFSAPFLKEAEISSYNQEVAHPFPKKLASKYGNEFGSMRGANRCRYCFVLPPQ